MNEHWEQVGEVRVKAVIDAAVAEFLAEEDPGGE